MVACPLVPEAYRVRWRSVSSRSSSRMIRLMVASALNGAGESCFSTGNTPAGGKARFWIITDRKGKGILFAGETEMRAI